MHDGVETTPGQCPPTQQPVKGRKPANLRDAAGLLHDLLRSPVGIFLVPAPARVGCKEKPYKTMRAEPDRHTRLGDVNLTSFDAQKNRFRLTTDRQTRRGLGSLIVP